MAPNVPEGMDPESFQKLLDMYQKEFPEKIETMKRAFEKLKEPFDVKELEKIRFVIHKLAGNAAMFGYPSITELCKKWDSQLTPMIKESNLHLEADFLKELEQCIQQIEKEFQSGPR